MNGTLIIDGDKEVSINQIKQWRTYSGLLEGLPTAGLNRSILSDTIKEAKKFCGIKEVYLIEPTETPMVLDVKYPYGDPVTLPGISCIAELWYHGTFKDESKDYSSLGLIWFQQDYAFPIEADIIEKIKLIPFSKLCGEYYFL